MEVIFLDTVPRKVVTPHFTKCAVRVPTLTGGKKYQLIDEGVFYVFQTVALSYLGGFVK